jgi:integrase
MRTYRQTLSPLMERIGHLRLDKLTPVALALTLLDLRRQGMGSRRVQMSYAALHTCLGAAVRLGIITANPLGRVDKPRHQAAERVCWTEEEARRFIQIAGEARHRYAPLLLVLLGGGLRVSEARGLSWGDIDGRAGTASITKALVFAGEAPDMEGTKSRAGTRIIALPGFCFQALSRLPRPLDAAAPIFTTEAGTPPRENILRQTLHALCKRAGVPRITIHDLRHVHASISLAAGVDLATVSKRLGHSKISTTANIYTHAIRPDRSAVDAFERAVNGRERLG